MAPLVESHHLPLRGMLHISSTKEIRRILYYLSDRKNKEIRSYLLENKRMLEFISEKIKYELIIIMNIIIASIINIIIVSIIVIFSWLTRIAEVWYDSG